MGKRILQDNDWYRTLLRDNVEFVNDPIARITKHGVLTGDEVERALDVLVLATGFQPKQFLWRMEIRGRANTRLGDDWGEDPRAKVHSYYNNRAGRVTTNSPWKLLEYWRMTFPPDLADFVVRGS